MSSHISRGKLGPVQLFSGSLAASGAFTATTALSGADYTYATVHLTYTTGSGAGAVKLYAQTSPDGTNWFDKTVVDGPASGSTGLFECTTDTLVYKFPSKGNHKSNFTFPMFGAKAARLQVAEHGVTGSAGTAIISVTLKKDIAGV